MAAPAGPNASELTHTCFEAPILHVEFDSDMYPILHYAAAALDTLRRFCLTRVIYRMPYIIPSFLVHHHGFLVAAEYRIMEATPGHWPSPLYNHFSHCFRPGRLAISSTSQDARNRLGSL